MPTLSSQIKLLTLSLITALLVSYSSGEPSITSLVPKEETPSIRSVLDPLPEDESFFVEEELISEADLETLLAEASSEGNQLTVTTTVDGIELVDEQLSLRKALIIANNRPGADQIWFARELEGRTITLQSALPVIRDDVVIEGLSGQTPTISGNNSVRVFEIAVGAEVEISRVTISNGVADQN